MCEDGEVEVCGWWLISGDCFNLMVELLVRLVLGVNNNLTLYEELTGGMLLNRWGLSIVGG